MKTCQSFSKADVSRFWSYVEVTNRDDCWLWAGGVFTDGYGQFKANGRPYRSHRVAWELTSGAITDDQLVCHQCDNPLCCNPYHLFLGSHLDNHTDRGRKGRTAKGERHGRYTKPESTARGDRHGTSTHPESTAKGSRNGWARLTEDQVLRIRELYATGRFSQADLCRKFKVGRCAINRVVRRQGWKHI